jgi:tripartite-type tricarboxylate transporter receptor subunit TctC
MKKISLSHRSLFLLIILLSAHCAHSSNFPQRPIRLISPFSAGGGNDIISRALANALSLKLNQSVVVDNRPGANTILAMELLAHASKDGYTILMSSSSQAINATLYPQLPYDSIRDFSPISRVGISPLVVAVHPSLAIHNISDLIAAAKANPGKILYPSAGIGNSTHLAGELFATMSGVRLTHIPYKGAGPGMVDLLAGRLQAVFATAPTAIPHLRTARLRPLALTSLKRSALLPDLPTVSESGIPGFEACSWYGVIAPSGTPSDAIQVLSRSIKVILSTTEFRQQLETAGADPDSNTPAEFAQYIKNEISKWAKVIKLSGATAP